MKLARVGLKNPVSAPGISGDWYQMGKDNIIRIDLVGGSTVIIGKGGGNATTIAVPIENVAYFVPEDLRIFDEQPLTIPAQHEYAEVRIHQEALGAPSTKRGPGRPKKQPAQEPESAS
jgi:hypothetical protein